jgi:hypothetical protein
MNCRPEDLEEIRALMNVYAEVRQATVLQR